MRARFGTTPPAPLNGADLTTIAAPSEMARYLRVAQRLRRAEMRGLMRRFSGWLARLASGRSRMVERSDPSAPSTRDRDIQHQHTLRTALTVIRTTAEILRDEPDLAPAERTRLVRMLLDEEARLERLLLADPDRGHPAIRLDAHAA